METNGRDLRDLVFGDELARTPEVELQAISNHPARQDELNRLLRLREAMLSLAEEEPPRRTVLVAPPMESSTPWWKHVLGFGSPGWGFVGAMALAVAILAHGWMARPVVNQQVAATPATDSAPAVKLEDVDARVQAELDKHLAAMVQQVRTELQSEHKRDAEQLVAAAERRLQAQHDNEMYQMREAVSFIQKKYGRQMVANVALMGGGQ